MGILSLRKERAMNRVKKMGRGIWAAAFMAAAIFAASSAAHAEGVVSKAEAAEGWIGLFDGETLFGWNDLGDVQWKAEGGNITADTGTGGWIFTTASFADFEMTAKVRAAGSSTLGIVVRGALEGHPSENGSAAITISQEKDNTDWHEVKISANGDKITASVDGKAVEGVTATNKTGHVGFQFHTCHRTPKNKVEITEVKLKPINLKPIFNGKDLSEWNIIPGRKSVFSVVDGAINIKDGNGQIETKGTYRDFTLQLDIISNGKQLNSGVFYRGPVGVFWKGYESQVRNHWTGDDRTKPVDFGTGGNYGNQPARKVVSSDGEWFKKTVVCHGNHTSIWIDGYLVSDYTDTRAVSKENDGKNGYVPIAGTIHLQGHDPTTDLSFKNINLQEYK
jgi:hypothetical protein